jgi:catechol 2,3-dioxygenase-like lactoylglutathione lyase family enzyme
MDQLTKLLEDRELGRIDRRHFLQALGLTTGAALGIGALPRAAAALSGGAQAGGAGKPFPVSTVNHLSISTPNYARSRDFYIDLFGMRDAWDDGVKCQVDFGSMSAPNSMYIVGQAKPGGTPTISHYAFGVDDFWARREALKAELDRGGYDGVRADGEAGFMVNGPSGYQVQPVPVKDAAMFPGAASPCEVAKSEKCKAAYEAGLKNLAAMPKPSGRGFTATHFKHIVLHVKDIGKERDFYTSLLGLKVVSEKADECALRFGQNTLVLRPTGPDGKPYINELGFAVERYDSAKAKAELDRRGLNPKPGSTKGAWMFDDPDGFHLEVAG